MGYRSAADILAEADARGLRKALFVTALQLEMEAVQSHIEHIGSVASDDGSIYECGIFSDQGNDWLIVVTETGAGTHPALSAVSYAHRALGEFEVQILVGIGGSRKAEAPIGTVVASENVYMPYSAKYGENGRSSRPRTFQVDRHLIGIAKKVRREHVWPSRIVDPLDYALPPRDEYPVAFPPVGLVQAICSVEAVLDDPTSELETLIAEGYGDTYVVEMEGYGAVYAASVERTPSIVVRGVSDMTQQKSAEDDARYQPIAAAHAAAFAFEMLSHWGQIHPRPGSSKSTLTANAIDTERHSGGPERDTEAAPAPPPVPPNKAVAPAALPAADIVLNLSGGIDQATPDWIARLQHLLREVAKDEAVVVVRVEAGSVRAFVADPHGALLKTDITKLGEAIDQSLNVELVGMASVADADWAADVAGSLRAASSDLLSWPQALPDGQRLERPEFASVTDRIEGSTSSTSVLLGAPGAGKSALLASLAHHHIERGWPVLAIKADALDPDIATEADLAQNLGLQAPPSQVIARIARFQPVLLVIDQLDALAGYLDIRTARLSILLNLVRQLGRLDNVHIVVSARTFEFNHDTRLRAINAERIDLGLPALSSVIEVLEQEGVKATGWPLDAQEVMRTPQTLALYLRLDRSRQPEPFKSYQAMLEQLWQERVLVGSDGPRRAALVADIADKMAEEESLWLAAVRFEDRRDDLKAVEAAGILVEVDGSIGFTHQTVFDFALARGFAREPGRLSRYALDRQNSLFLRPKLWSGLTYLRGVDINAYHAEIQKIWTEPDLRRHLRFLLIDFLGHEKEPTDREALLMEQALTVPHERWRAFRAMAGSPGWFERFGSTFIRDAMMADEESANRMIDILARAWPFAANEVTALMEAAWLNDPASDNRIWAVLQSADVWSEKTLAIAETIIDRADVAPSRVDWIVAAIGADQPEFAIRLVVATLNRLLVKAEAEAIERSKVPRPETDDYSEYVAWHMKHSPRDPIKKLVEDSREWDSLQALAGQSPEIVLAQLWSWYLTALQILARVEEERDVSLGFPLAYLIDYRFADEARHGLPEAAILGAIRTAVEATAEAYPEKFRDWAKEQARIDWAPVQQLLAHVFLTFPERFAGDTLAFLLEDNRRFSLGTTAGITSTTKRLIAATSPNWSGDQIAAFEAAVAAFDPPARKDLDTAAERRSWRNAIRRIKLDMLRSLPKNRMSAAARRQVLEEERRFGPARDSFVTTGVRTIESPLSAEGMRKASNDDIVGAFETLPDASGWDHPRNWMAGGNVQLSREFATFAAQEPYRAVEVIKRLTPENGTRATGNAIEALGEAADPALIFELLNDAIERGFDGDEFCGSAARGLEKLVRREQAIPAEVLDTLEGWLTSTAPPDAGEEVVASPKDDAEIDTGVEAGAEKPNRDHESLVWGYGGLTVVPHGDYPILETLTHARLNRGESDRLIQTLSNYVERGTDPDMWEHLLRFFPHIKPSKSEDLGHFVRKLFGAVPKLVGTKGAAHFIANLHWDDPQLVADLLPAWRNADTAQARMAYGEIVTIVALVRPELPWAADALAALLDDKMLIDARIGAAHSAVNLWADQKHRVPANAILLRLLEDGPGEVWNPVFDLFRVVDDLSPDEPTVTLLTAFADRLSAAPKLDPHFVVERLAGFLPHQAQLVGRLSRALIEYSRDDLGDIRTSTAAAASDLVNMAVTLHRLGPETRELGTTLFELLLEIESYAALETLEELDSRFRDRPAMARRRLSRRSKSRRRVRRVDGSANESAEAANGSAG